jgi:hypothetical protein
MSHQSRCMFALHMHRLAAYPDDAILRDSRIPSALHPLSLSKTCSARR